MIKLRRPTRCVVAVALAMAFSASWTSEPAEAATLRVPAHFTTIQAAIDAANPGDIIRVSPGSYPEQLTIGKDLKLTGSGAGSTIIRAPETLVAGAAGTSSIVDIQNGASVTMSRLTVGGPGAGNCDEGSLRAGIQVFDGAHLELSFAAVTHIHNTPIAPCGRDGQGIRIGGPPFTDSTGSANIRYSKISAYQYTGVAVVNEGSVATISRNVVTGPDLPMSVPTSGIDVVLGATATVSYNVISGNRCESADLGCGPDFFTEFQYAGVSGDGVVVTRNFIYGNQVGIYAGGSAEISQNLIVGNDDFGIALQDGTFTVRNDVIRGGIGGIAVIAASADTEATLDNVNIADTSGAPVQEFECCGFAATVIEVP